MFLMFSPREILENIVLVETNTNIKKDKLEVAYFGEFFQLIGTYIFMSTLSGSGCSNLLSIQSIETFRGAPYFHHGWMYLRHFQGIPRNITYMDYNPQMYMDCLW